MLDGLIRVLSQIVSTMRNAIKACLDQVRYYFFRVIPSKQIWRGAGIGIGVLGYLAAIIMGIDGILPVGWPYFLGALIFFPIGYGLAVFLALVILRWLMKLPPTFLWLAIVGFLFTMTAFGLFDLSGAFMGVLTIVLGGLIGAGIWPMMRGRWPSLSQLQKGFSLVVLLFGIIGILILLWWLLDEGRVTSMTQVALDEPKLSSLADMLPDPSSHGTYDVLRMSYGSGTDRRQPEFAEGVSFITDTVDGSPFIEGWTWLRTWIWGFDEKALPLNGRVWYPEGEGPFPLVLVVHGNHLAEDYSDPGYAYLCDLLASRGSICVSVDQNFLNGSVVGDLLGFKGLKDENDCRGWLLLEHLSFWERLATDVSMPFYGRVDLDKIALIGHSRGGEAVGIAATFNNLAHYPDNANIEFDYGFVIRSIIMIAPVDRQYQPASEPLPLEDVNLLIMHGSHDMDVTSFDGYHIYKRTAFSDETSYFKSTLYVWGANHGQFNTLWGDKDTGTPPIWLYNRAPLISGEEQTKIAQVYISAFIETTLGNEYDYLPLFQNYQRGLDWLPETIYINSYADSQTDLILTYEEDVDLTSGTNPDVSISASNLKTWREDRVRTKKGQIQTNSAAYLGWHQSSSTPTYTTNLGESARGLTKADQLTLSLAQVVENLDDSGESVPVNFSLVLIDEVGHEARLPLSSISALQPEIEAQIMKLGFLSDKPASEAVFQTYLFNLRDFTSENPDLDVSNLREIQLVFDRTDHGLIVLDDLGFRKMNSGTNN